jgi:hypothetical protein
MSLIETKVPGAVRVRVLVVDATGNKGKWEYQCSQKVVDLLRQKSVPVVGGVPRLAPDMATFVRVFEMVKDDPFNVLLLMTHGWAGCNGAVDGLDVGDLPTNWFLLQQVEMHLENKLVLLCVCEGYGKDSIETVVTGDHFALMLIGPQKKISRKQAEDFFPTFLSELKGLSYGSIDPEVVKQVLGEQNHLAGGQMQLFSGVG